MTDFSQDHFPTNNKDPKISYFSSIFQIFCNLSSDGQARIACVVNFIEKNIFFIVLTRKKNFISKEHKVIGVLVNLFES